MTNPIISTLMTLDDAYFNKQAKIPDASYDIIRQAAQKKWPNDPYFKTVGVSVKKDKVKLSAPKPGMPQMRPDEAVAWMHKIKAYTISAKVDGISCQLTYKNRKLILGTTRGDGNEGQDVTEFLKHVVGVWPTLSNKWSKKTIIIDGEVSMHRSVFSKLNLDKYVNTRSLCNAILVTSKEVNQKLLSKMVCITYGWQEAGVYPPAKYTQLSNLDNEGFITVNNCGTINTTDADWMKYNTSIRYIPRNFVPFKHWYREKPVTKAWILSTLDHLRKEFDLDLDGLVATVDGVQKKAMVYSYKIKPDPEDQETKVGIIKHIEWNLSPRALLKPVVVLKTPLEFNGTMVKRITAVNAATVVKQGLTVGAKIRIIKSGMVIARIMGREDAENNKQKTVSKKIKR